jgi:hypothetical protein
MMISGGTECVLITGPDQWAGASLRWAWPARLSRTVPAACSADDAGSGSRRSSTSSARGPVRPSNRSSRPLTPG